MPKEMIVSVNGREKKIAVIENGLVTEFYIERGEGGESGAGIVGNIYKGRVQRVLPGMQSAFVDIGLERDAFLYVSDFFDEEEDVERGAIVAKGAQVPDGPAAAREPVARESGVAGADEDRAEADGNRRGRSRRGRGGDRGRGDARDGGRDTIRDDESRRADVREPDARAVAREAVVPLSDLDTTPTRQPEGTPFPALEPDADDDSAPQVERRAENRSEEFVRPEPVRPEEIATPFVAPLAFERVSDPEEIAETAGDLLKDAIIQERLTDQTRRVEFDLPEQTPHTIGSLLEATSTATGAFERISDDAGEAETAASTARTPAPVVAVRSFDELAPEASAPSAANATPAFERVSDDETAADAPQATAQQPALGSASATSANDAAAEEAPARRTRTRRGRKQDAPEAGEPAAEAVTATSETTSGTANEIVSDSAAGAEAAPARKRRGASRAASKSASDEAGGRTRRSRRTDALTGDAATTDAAQTSSGDDAGESGELFADADASVRSSAPRGEFARRRRRGGRRQANGTAVDEGGDAESGDAAATDTIETVGTDDSGGATEGDDLFAESFDDLALSADDAAGDGHAATAAGDADSAASANADDDSGASRGISGTTLGGNGGGAPAGNRREARAGRERRERSTPAISDLLREGQEVLVQIAKEPIAAKGARITSHVALPGRFLVYMPTVEHVGVSRKIESDSERQRLRKMITAIRKEEDVPSGGFIVRTAGTNITEQDLREDARYLVRTWRDIRRASERAKSPALVHKDLDLVQRLLRDQLSDDFAAIRVDSEEEYLQVVEFVNRIQPRLVNRVKLHTREEPILEAYGVQDEIDKAIKPRVWLKSGGYLVINQTEALVAIDVNTGKFVGRGGSRLEDTITKTNMEAVEEIARQIRLRDLGGIIVLDLIDMEERRNRARVMQALQDALENDKSPTKVLSFNDFGLVIMTRKRVKQSLERTLCSPCPYCTGAGLVKSPQTVAYEILEEARRLARGMRGDKIKSVTLRVHPEVAGALRSSERDVFTEIEAYLGAIDLTSDDAVHQEQFDFAIV